MRRVFLILIVVLVVLGLAGVVLLYLHRNTAEKLLQRSELALRAKQYDRAMELAGAAADKEPANWLAYFKQAQALCGKGQYDEARKLLEESAKHDPPGVTIPLAMADTYAMPARRSLASEEALRQPSVIQDAIAGIRQANDYLSRVTAKDNAGVLDVQQIIGLNLTQIGGAQQGLRDRLEKEARLAATKGDTAANIATKQKAAQEAGREAGLSLKQATDVLAAVVKQDPGRAGAARTLVDLCVQRNDRKALEAARQAIMSLEDPPPAAVVKLIRSEFRSVGEVAEEAKHLESLTRQLDRILEKHPDDNDAKLAKAEVTVRAGDVGRALELCTQILDSKPEGEQKFGTRFLRARILVSQSKWSEAERELYSLKTEAPLWANGQYFYGKVAHEMGKEERAREAMRAVTDIERQFPRPDPAYAEAHRYLAESLLGSGFAAEAFTEAKAFYEAVCSDPSEAAVQNLPLALRLYVQAANETKQVGLARTALNAALKDHASNPDVLLAVYEGYRQLGEKPEVTRKTLEKAAECTPAANDVLGRLTVARATALLGRISEAERMLTDEAGRNPKDARVLFELGRFFTVTGRLLQAIGPFRKAVSLDDRNLSYRESLAAALYESGLHDECLTECQAILDRRASNAAAVRLVNLIRLARGQDLLPQSGPGTLSGRALAQALLSNGRPQQCVEACLTQLKETPNDAEILLLLGQAYQVLGQNDKCIEQWTAVLKQMPDKLPIYLQLAGIMSGTLKPEAVEKALAALPGANQNLVDLAVGWLLDRRGQFDEAAEIYGHLASRQGAPEDIRNLARIFRARSLSSAGHLDQATTELDQVAATSPVRAQALYDKASLLATANRSSEADAILADLVQQAVKDKDLATLERVTSLYSRLKQTDKALAVCEQMDKVLPNDAGPCLVRANVLAAAGRLNEAIAFYQQAIERQPGNLRSYTALARALDATARPLEALATLKQLEGLGQTGHLEALLQQGSMFVRWGLPSQAVESFEQAAKLIREADPKLQLALGQAFAELGGKDRARAILGAIPEYASQYITARQILASLEDTEEARLAVLRQAQKVKPDSPALFIQEMNILLRANRPDDVLKVFKELDARRPPAAVMPDEALNPALQALLMTGDLAGAAGLTAQAAQSTGDPRWLQTAVLLALGQKPESAKALLPKISAAGPYEAMLGLLVASQTGQPVAPWKKRLDQIQQTMSQMNPPQSISPGHKTLVALAAGVRADAEAEVAAAKKGGSVARQAADETLASSKQNPKSSEEAANLLKASLASELGMPLLGRTWAMQVLRARPTCQWAATIILQSTPDAATVRQMLQILQPADCLLARTAQATLAAKEKQHDQSVELCQAALATDRTNAELVVNLAMALESAGRPADALLLYRQMWDANQSPIAGNNGAYIISCLYPKDAAKLAEAQKWAEAAVKAAPGVPGFRDTLGWVAYLQGRNDEAIQSLHQAVRGFPTSPEIHFHLGQAEAKANHVDLARWHLAATVNLVEKLKADGATPAASALEAADQARQALAALERPKS
jgi:tetratricopeptide (TPR) repeat protein